MARLGKKETLRLCDKIILGRAVYVASVGSVRDFNAGFVNGLSTAVEMLGVSQAAVFRCYDLVEGWLQAGKCPAWPSGRCVPRCDCHARGLPRAQNDGELLYLLGFKTWEEIHEEPSDFATEAENLRRALRDDADILVMEEIDPSDYEDHEEV